MSEAYSVYWPQPRWRHAAAVRQRITVLFGGPPASEPSFRRATGRTAGYRAGADWSRSAEASTKAPARAPAPPMIKVARGPVSATSGPAMT